MAKHECESEILELRDQIEKLVSQQAAQQERLDSQQEASNSATNSKTATGDLAKIRESLEEFMELLEQDLKQVPVTTAVAIFGLGVLFGRLMPR